MGLKVRREEKGKTALFEWEEGVFFEVKYLSRQRRKELARRATTTIFVKHQRREDFDADKLGEMLLKEAIVGWKGLKYKHLLSGLCEPDIKIEADPEEEIPYDEETKEDLIKLRTLTFENFIIYALDTLEEMREEKLKNLKSTSGGSKVQAGSQRSK